MAFDKTPTEWVDGIEYKAASATVTADSLVIPLSALDGLVSTDITDAVAGDNTADIRKIFRGLCAMMLAGQAEQDVADLPSRMRLALTAMPLEVGYAQNVYSFAFVNAVTAEEVANEAE